MQNRSAKCRSIDCNEVPDWGMQGSPVRYQRDTSVEWSDSLVRSRQTDKQVSRQEDAEHRKEEG